MKYFACILALAIVLCASSADSQTLTTLVEFTGTGGTASGRDPIGSLTLSGTTLYGMTCQGGANGDGNLFSVATNGSNYQNLLSFTGTAGFATGSSPFGSLTLSGTTLYGAAETGGVDNDGVIFSVGIDGTNYQILASFTGTGGSASGAYPRGSLTLSGTTLYGMTTDGGADGDGNVFSVGTRGTNYKSLISFTGNGGTASGLYPFGSLTLSGTTLYGMTTKGGVNGKGNVFSLGTNGTNYNSVLSFTGSGGAASGNYPAGSLTLSGTTFYGMTTDGGADGDGNVFGVGTNGTNYQNLLSFSGTGGMANGYFPWGSLIISGTTLYGMTQLGGADVMGNIFSVGIDGSNYQDLYDFIGGAGGGGPQGDLLLSGGTLFGMTAYGGANGNGIIFALSLPAPTPEPGTLALLAAGTLGLVGLVLRRRRAVRTAASAAFDPQDAPPILSFSSHSSTANAARRAA